MALAILGSRKGVGNVKMDNASIPFSNAMAPLNVTTGARRPLRPAARAATQFIPKNIPENLPENTVKLASFY